LTGWCGFTGGSRTGLPKTAPEFAPTCTNAAPLRRVGRVGGGCRPILLACLTVPLTSPKCWSGQCLLAAQGHRAGRRPRAARAGYLDPERGAGRRKRPADRRPAPDQHPSLRLARPGLRVRHARHRDQRHRDQRHGDQRCRSRRCRSQRPGRDPVPDGKACTHSVLVRDAPRGREAPPPSGGPARPARGRCGRLLRREPRPEPVLRPVQLPGARPPPTRRQRGVHCARPVHRQPGGCPPGHPDQGGGKDAGLGLRGLRPVGPFPGHDAGPGSARGGPLHLGPDDLGSRLPPPAPDCPAWHLHRHGVQREPE
jgi:hypothetical protein